VAVLSPNNRWAGEGEAPGVAVDTSATTKISCRVGSMTGVPVIPTVGPMLPQGSADAATGVARWFDHTTAPVEAERASTVSFSVAT
jgi:hypothetical protein